MGARGTPPSRMPTCSGLMAPYCLTYSSRGGSPTRACTMLLRYCAMSCGATGRNAVGWTRGGDGVGAIVPATQPVPWQGRNGVAPAAPGP
eukprot:4331317-Alexandrium_andersonii.AAC.1